MRVALVTNIPSPYRIPVFRALAATPGWRLRVFASAQSEFDRSWQVDLRDLDLQYVKSWSFRRRVATRGRFSVAQVVTVHVPVGLIAALRRFAPHVVISTELGARTLLALVYCKLLGIPLVIWSYHSRVSATSAGFFQRALRRVLLATASAVVGMGRQAREVLRRLGVRNERIFDAPNAHDHDAIVAARARIDPAALRRGLQLRLGCRERIALVVGRLVPVKGISALLQAWERVPDRVRADWTLLFVGSGPLGSMVQEASGTSDPGEIVHVASVQPNEVVDYYAAAQLLVFPTLGDTWGLVVNEAFACGVPALVSRLAGCADDVVEPGRNGWIFDPMDGDDFARALIGALSHPQLARLGARARETAERLRPEVMAAGIRGAALHALKAPSRAPEAPARASAR